MKIIILLIFLILSSLNSLQAKPVTEIQFLDQAYKIQTQELALLDLALQKSENNDLKKFAKKNRREQKKYLDTIKDYRAKWYESDDFKADQSKKFDRKEFEKYSGAAFDKAFIESLMNLHKESIQSVSKMMPELERPEIHHFALKMIKSKGNEMDKMERIKSSLK